MRREKVGLFDEYLAVVPGHEVATAISEVNIVFINDLLIC